MSSAAAESPQALAQIARDISELVRAARAELPDEKKSYVSTSAAAVGSRALAAGAAREGGRLSVLESGHDVLQREVAELRQRWADLDSALPTTIGSPRFDGLSTPGVSAGGGQHHSSFVFPGRPLDVSSLLASIESREWALRTQARQLAEEKSSQQRQMEEEIASLQRANDSMREALRDRQRRAPDAVDAEAPDAEQASTVFRESPLSRSTSPHGARSSSPKHSDWLPSALSASAPVSQIATGEDTYRMSQVSAGRVLLFKVRRAWLAFSDAELEMYMPGYRPSVKLHSTVSMDISFRSRSPLRGTVGRGVGTDVVRRVSIAETSGALFKALLYVVDPNKPLRLAWNIPALLCVIYDTVMVPLQAFDVEDEPSVTPTFRFVDWLVTIFWTLDMVVSMRTGYYEGTVLEMRPRKIVSHYVKTWFIVDFPLIVMEWVSRLAMVLETASMLRVTRIFRIVRCVRLLRLAKLQTIWNLVEARMSSGIILLFFSIAKMVLAFMFFVHAISCAWYAIGQARGNGWTSYEPPIEDHIAFWYFSSCRWTLAQINGRTDMNEQRNMLERMYTCLISVCFAVIFMAVFLSSVTTTMIELGTLSEERNTSKRGMNTYLDHERLSVKLVASIRRHLASKVSLQALANEKARERLVLSQIPEHLQYDLLHEVRAPVLRWHSFFRDVEQESTPVMRCLCFAAIRPLLAHRCEEIFDQGNKCSRMFFLERGKCVYEQFDRAPESDMSKGRVVRTSTGSRLAKRQRRTTKLEGAVGQPSRSSRRLSAVLAPQARTSVAEAAQEEEWDAIWKVKPGMWLSEAALWMEWENQGQLAAEHDSCLYTIEVDDLAQALRDYKDGFAMAAVYGRTFVEELKIQPELTDLIHVAIHRRDDDPTDSLGLASTAL